MIVVRPIRPEHDREIATVVRETLVSFGACGEGFAGADEELEGMSRAYHRPGHRYFVLVEGDRVVGGGGIGALSGADPAVCELRKMYFRPELRGRGQGTRLLARCLQVARELGYRRCYLETLGNMDAAQSLYRRFGFRELHGPLGATGHFGCDRWFERDLDAIAPREHKFADPRSFAVESEADDASRCVVREQDEVLGSLTLGAANDPAFGRLRELFVEPRSRRTGVGERLVANGIAVAARRGLRGCEVELGPEMDAARRLLLRFGFSLVQRSGATPGPERHTLLFD